jgi:tetratricopeptide (TPR) repeat protein
LEKYEQALALDIYITKFAADHPDVACVYAEQGEYDKALEKYEQALEIRIIKLRAGPHPDLIDTANRMIDAYEELGFVDKALELRTKYPDPGGSDAGSGSGSGSDEGEEEGNEEEGEEEGDDDEQ